MDGRTPFLERAPREIHDKIYRLVLLDPARPTLEGEGKSTEYKNYLGLSYVNKQVNEEVKVALENIKPLFIISCNVSDLGDEMMGHGIPYLSDHHAGRVKCSSLRIHVKFPTPRNNRRQLKAYVVLSEYLSETCVLLRGLSLDPANIPDPFTTLEGFLVPKMKIAIKLASHENASMLETTQVQLLKQMIWLKHVGGVTTSGFDIDAIERKFQGHDYLVPARSGRSNASSEQTADTNDLYERLLSSDIADGKDFIEIACWKNAIAARAYRAKDYHLAVERYFETLGFFTRGAETFYYHILSVAGESIEKVDICKWEAVSGIVGCCLVLGEWERAARYFKEYVIINGHRVESLPQWLKDRVGEIREQLLAIFGEDDEHETDRELFEDGQHEGAEEQQA